MRLPNRRLSLSLAAILAFLFPFHALGASILLRGPSGTEDAPAPIAHDSQGPTLADTNGWQAQLVRRMENFNPNVVQPFNPNAPNQQPIPHPNILNPFIVENQGVPGVNLPCGWLDGHSNPDGEAGIDSEVFRLNPGRYILHFRWTRTPRLAGVRANVNLIDIDDYNEQEEFASMFFPATRMPTTLVVDPPGSRDFFLDLRRDWTEDDDQDSMHGTLVNDAAIIWWFERVYDAASGGRAPLRSLVPVDLGVEPPSQRARANL